MPSCYANNPPSPYGVTFLPKAPHEDTSTYSNWGITLSHKVNGVQMSSSFRLDANETVVMLGQTPPRALYYSYIPYVFDRLFPKGWSSKSTDWSKCPNVTDPLGTRCKIFASLGNPINMLNINTSNYKGQSFNSAFAHFMGGDQTQIQTIVELSEKVGIPQSIHNVFGLSTERAKLGLMREDDAIMHLSRVAFIEDADEFQKYIYNPSNYTTILRVTPSSKTIKNPMNPFPPQIFKKRVSEVESVLSEGFSHQRLTSILENDLRKGILQQYKTLYPHVSKFPIEPPLYRNGYDCMDRGMQCNGDNQDTIYPNARNAILSHYRCLKMFGQNCPIVNRTTLQKDGSDFFIVTGVNHNATSRALYSSISMYSLPRLESLGGFNSLPINQNNNSYVGSANKYLQDQGISKYFFAIKVSRSCKANESFCLQVKDVGSNSLSLDQPCAFIERSYLDKMEAGPTTNAHIKSVVYHFSSKRIPENGAIMKKSSIMTLLLIFVVQLPKTNL